MDDSPVEPLRKAIHTAAILRTENVMLTAPEARALLAHVTDLEKFSEPPVSGFPISKQIDNSLSIFMMEKASNEHRLGLHEYSMFCPLCVAG